MYLDGDLLVLGELINIWIWVEPGASGSKGQVPRCSIDTVVFTTDPAQNFVIGSDVFIVAPVCHLSLTLFSCGRSYNPS
jgi:hypothetical protein